MKPKSVPTFEMPCIPWKCMKYICGLSNDELQEEVGGAETFHFSFRSLFGIPQGGTQNQIPSVFLLQPEKTVRPLRVPLDW